MGTVYEAEDRETGVRLALKVVRKARDAEALMRFKREFRAVAGLHHPNLVRLYELHIEDPLWFYTMELVDGRPILEVLTGATGDAHTQRQVTLRMEPISAQALSLPALGAPRQGPACDLMALGSVLSQVLDALEFLHARGIVHRDLKPDNILIDVQGRVRLMDFGLVKLVHDGVETGQKGQVMGTVAYMAPEQAVNRAHVEPPADLYALGCILYQLLTGALPFEGATFQVLMAHQSEPVVPIERRVEGVPEALLEVVHALLSKDPTARPGVPEIRRRLSLVGAPEGGVVSEAGLGERLVGREAELAMLVAPLDEALGGGGGQVVMLQGASGLGKTALAQAAVAEARRRGFVVFRGRCYEREALPFRAFDQIIDALALALRQWPEERLEGLREALAVAGQVFPALRLVSERPGAEGAAPPLAHLSPFELREVAFGRLRRLLVAVQESAPVLLVIDDLQWTDPESMALLEALLREPPGRVVVVGTFRPEGISGEHPLMHALSAMEGARRARVLELGPLPGAQVAEIMREVAAAAPGALGSLGGMDALVAQTGGNPLFAVELARVLASDEVQRRIAARGALPTVAELVAWRVEGLSGPARQVLELASVAGGASSIEVLRLASAMEPEGFAAALDELEAGQLVRPALEEVGGAGLWDLYHTRLRELVYEGLEPARRAALHRAMGLALEEVGGDHAHAEALLRHWEEVGDRERVVRYVGRAAAEAEAQLAFASAAGLYRRALEIEPERPPVERLALWEKVGALHDAAGAERQAIEAWRQAEALVRDGHTPQYADASWRPLALRRYRRHIASALFRVRALDESQRLYQELLAPMRLRLRRDYGQGMAVLGWLQLLLLCWSLAPDAWFSRRPTPRDKEDMALWEDITNSVGWMWLMVGFEYNARAILLARRLDDDIQQLRARAIRTGTLAFSGARVPAVRAWCQRSFDRLEARARAQGTPLGPEFVGRWRGACLLHDDIERAREVLLPAVRGYGAQGALRSDDGIWAQGWLILAHEALGEHEALLARSLELESCQSAWANAFAFAPRIRSLARRGEFDEVDAILARWEPMLPTEVTAEHFWWALSLGMADVNRGRFDAVLERHDGLFAKVRDYGTFLLDFNLSFWLAPYVRALVGKARCGELSTAQQGRAVYLAQRLEREAIAGFRPAGARAQALLAHFQGHRAQALDHLRRALRLSATCQLPYHRWLCLEAARELDAIDDAQAAEADRLHGEHGFVREP